MYVSTPQDKVSSFFFAYKPFLAAKAEVLENSLKRCEAPQGCEYWLRFAPVTSSL